MNVSITRVRFIDSIHTKSTRHDSMNMSHRACANAESYIPYGVCEGCAPWPPPPSILTDHSFRILWGWRNACILLAHNGKHQCCAAFVCVGGMWAMLTLALRYKPRVSRRYLVVWKSSRTTFPVPGYDLQWCDKLEGRHVCHAGATFGTSQKARESHDPHLQSEPTCEPHIRREPVRDSHVLGQETADKSDLKHFRNISRNARKHQHFKCFNGTILYGATRWRPKSTFLDRRSLTFVICRSSRKSYHPYLLSNSPTRRTEYLCASTARLLKSQQINACQCLIS